MRPDKTQHSDLAAAIGVGLVLAQLLFAQVTLVLTICFLIANRLIRWRPVWLAVPAATGFAWVLAIGVRPAFAGFLAAGSHLIGVFGGPETLPARLAKVPRAVTAWHYWVPGQLPVALIVAGAQAAALRLTGQAAPSADYRPGLITLLRNQYLVTTLRRGEVAIAAGCCLGVIGETGSPAALTWTEAEAGVLCIGDDQATGATWVTLAVAAIQHRKTVIVVDLLAGQHDPIGAACADLEVPVQRFGRSGTHYDPLSSASPAKATSLVMAMVDWTGVPHAEQLACANYLNEALSIVDPKSSSGVLAELVRVEGDQAVLAPWAARLRALESDAAGAWLRPSPGAISLGRALAERQVVQFQLGPPRPIVPAAMVARLVVADLIGSLMLCGDAGYRNDCAVLINGCDVIDARQLSVLISLGERTGTAVVLSTSDPAAASRLAAEVNVIAARGALPGDIDIDIHVDGLAELLTEAPPDQLVLSVRRPVAWFARCKVVR